MNASCIGGKFGFYRIKDHIAGRRKRMAEWAYFVLHHA